MPTPFVGGNWKCKGTRKSIVELCAAFNSREVSHNVDVVVAPPYLHIPLVSRALVNPAFNIAAQNCIAAPAAFTGEVCADQIVDYGLRWVILGHSERRAKAMESDQVIGEKVAACLAKGLSVIACVGESLDERKANQTLAVVERQLKAIIDNVSDWKRVVIAYEPVWAIGTGVVATPDQAQEVHASIRRLLSEKLTPAVATDIRLIYGGSVTAGNAADLYSKADVNGFLPAFMDIIEATSRGK